MKDTFILIVAAGSSSRLGKPKQLLPFKNSFLLQEIINECISSQVGEVLLVLGANGELIESQLSGHDIRIVRNPSWEQGMANSIAFGVSQIKKKFKQVIIVMGDQVYFKANVLHDLMQKRKASDSHIIVSRYLEGQGPPVLFDHRYTSDLLLLNGDDGAKSVIKANIGQVKYVKFLQGHLDIDTEEDLHLLNI